MPSIILLPLLFCPLALGLIIARYRIRSADQDQTADCRLQQNLLEHMPQLPRPVVREWYGGSDVQTHASGPTRKQILKEARP